MGCCSSSSAMSGKYDEYNWAELPDDAKKAAKTLGYTQQIWEEDGDCPYDDKNWAELTKEQQDAAIVLGYNEEKWDDESSSDEE